jgi:hypothetical protein
MIVPITMVMNGVNKEVGTARIVSVDGDITVEFYLTPGFVLREQTQAELTASLKKLAQKQTSSS